MEYLKSVVLKNGEALFIRECGEYDAREVLNVFN